MVAKSCLTEISVMRADIALVYRLGYGLDVFTNICGYDYEWAAN